MTRKMTRHGHGVAECASLVALLGPDLARTVEAAVPLFLTSGIEFLVFGLGLDDAPFLFASDEAPLGWSLCPGYDREPDDRFRVTLVRNDGSFSYVDLPI